MNSYARIAIFAGTSFIIAGFIGRAEDSSRLIYETPSEFFGTGDFDGDGRADVVIVDKESGKYRVGYQSADGSLSWVDNRPSGIKGVSGFSIGKLLATNRDAMVLTSPDASELGIVEAAN